MSTKDFKQGMVAGAKPFGDKLDQLANVSESAVSDIQEGLDGVTEVVNVVVNDLSAQEKKRIYDLDQATDISSLEDDEKEFLVAVLSELASTVPETTELQKRYILSVCSTVGIVAPQASINLACVENINNMQSQKIILRHVMEFFFIGTQNYDFLDEYDDMIFSYFSVNRRGIKEIITIIDRIYNAMGIEGLANRYTFAADYVELPAEEDMDHLNENEFETDGDISPQHLEVVDITNMVQVAPGQTVKYEHKELHFASMVNCSGSLEFDNCVIVYGEKNVADEISINNGEMHATNCTFICKGVDTTPFITLEEGSSAAFDSCTFIDCSYFCKSDSDQLVSITNCQLFNCSACFFEGCNSNGNVQISSVGIFMDEHIQVPNKGGCLFKTEPYPTSICTVENLHVENSNFERHPQIEILCTLGPVKNSTFIRVDYAVSSGNVENCMFEGCHHAIYSLFSGENSHITSCVFDSCIEAVKIHDKSKISYCKFINCSDGLIEATSSTEVSSCEFINYKDTRPALTMGIYLSCGILFHQSKYSQNSVSKCVFDGIEINKGFLIATEITEKLSGHTATVSDCDFRNCSTKRDSGKIIKNYASYNNLFGKKCDELAVSIEKCRGLDSVKKNGCGICTDKAALSSVQNQKAITGANVATVGLGIAFGGPVGGLAMMGLNALTKKKKLEEQEKHLKAQSE